MKKTVFRLLSTALVLCMVLSLGVSAFAEVPQKTEVQAVSTKKDITVEYDKDAEIGWKGEGVVAGSSTTNTPHSASVTVNGNVTQNNAQDVTTVMAGAKSACTATATVNGDVTSTSTGGGAIGVTAQVGGGSDATVTVGNGTSGGNVTASGVGKTTGVYAKTTSSGDAVNVTVNGSLSANITGSNKAGVWGIDSVNPNGATTNITVGDGVTVQNASNGETCGIRSSVNGGSTTNIAVDGDVDVQTSGNGLSAGIYTSGRNSSEVNISVAGDLSVQSADASNDYGIYANLDNQAVINVLVEGTLSAGETPVYVWDDCKGSDTADLASQFNLTVWEITPNQQGDIVLAHTKNSDDDKNAAGAVEAAINYIIRKDFDDGAATVSGVRTVSNFDTAHEGESVTVRVNEVAGYSVSVMNNGTALVKDANGNFTLVVPKGGGVFLSIELSQIALQTSADIPVLLLEEDENDHIGLRLFADKTFVLRLEDGTKFFGVYDIVDGVIVFTMEDGTVVTATVEENGNQTFGLPIGNGASAHFTLKPEKLQKLLSLFA